MRPGRTIPATRSDTDLSVALYMNLACTYVVVILSFLFSDYGGILVYSYVSLVSSAASSGRASATSSAGPTATAAPAGTSTATISTPAIWWESAPGESSCHMNRELPRLDLIPSLSSLPFNNVLLYYMYCTATWAAKTSASSCASPWRTRDAPGTRGTRAPKSEYSSHYS